MLVDIFHKNTDDMHFREKTFVVMDEQSTVQVIATGLAFLRHPWTQWLRSQSTDGKKGPRNGDASNR